MERRTYRLALLLKLQMDYLLCAQIFLIIYLLKRVFVFHNNGIVQLVRPNIYV